MKKIIMRWTLLCLICITLFSPTQPIAQAQPESEVIVFAAASLTNAFTEISEVFETQYNIQVTLNFAGSSTLAAQLGQGALADIFASANNEQMQIVIEDDLIDEQTIEIFAENELVLVVPTSNPANISTIEDLANDNVLLSLAAPTVPIRVYTNQLLDNLSLIYGTEFVENVLDNIVSEETNVRQVMTRVALDEVDAGIVYRTDITPEISDRVLIIDVSEGLSPRVKYPIAPLIDAPNPQNAEIFMEFVLSDAGQSILQSWGFCLTDDSSPEMTPEPEQTPESEATPDIDHVFC